MRVTKKRVVAALGEVGGWNFAYNFKESNKIIIFTGANIPRILEALEGNAMAAVDIVLPKPPQTGSIEIAIL